jgi:hypothetical protein
MLGKLLLKVTVSAINPPVAAPNANGEVTVIEADGA